MSTCFTCSPLCTMCLFNCCTCELCCFTQQKSMNQFCTIKDVKLYYRPWDTVVYRCCNFEVCLCHQRWPKQEFVDILLKMHNNTRVFQKTQINTAVLHQSIILLVFITICTLCGPSWLIVNLGCGKCAYMFHYVFPCMWTVWSKVFGPYRTKTLV